MEDIKGSGCNGSDGYKEPVRTECPVCVDGDSGGAYGSNSRSGSGYCHVCHGSGQCIVDVMVDKNGFPIGITCSGTGLRDRKSDEGEGSGL